MIQYHYYKLFYCVTLKPQESITNPITNDFHNLIINEALELSVKPEDIYIRGNETILQICHEYTIISYEPNSIHHYKSLTDKFTTIPYTQYTTLADILQ